jgi:hypothetical protein
MDISRLPTASIRPTLSAVLGGIGGLFAGDGPVHRNLVAHPEVVVKLGSATFPIDRARPRRTDSATVRSIA